MANENEAEQFEKKQFEYEVQAQQELDKIEIAETKLIEEYGEYEALKSFVIYLSSMEKIFARSRIYSSSKTETKEEIIKAEMHFFSVDSALDENMLRSIKDDFGLAYMTISQAYAIAEKLLQKFSDKKNCQDFIKNLRDISITFIEAHDKNLSIDEVQERIYRSRMKIISADGDPEMSLLEKIYGEFKNEITTIKSAA
jgi:hypothetical protein